MRQTVAVLALALIAHAFRAVEALDSDGRNTINTDFESEGARIRDTRATGSGGGEDNAGSGAKEYELVGDGGCRDSRGQDIQSLDRVRVGADDVPGCIAKCAANPKCTGIEFFKPHFRPDRGNCQLQGAPIARSNTGDPCNWQLPRPGWK